MRTHLVIIVVFFALISSGCGNTNSPTNTDPKSISGVLAAGGHHVVTLKNNGAVLAWGNNYYGQLGNGATIYSSTPVKVINLSTTVTAIAAGNGFKVAGENDRTVWAWGDNNYGQLGDGTVISHNTPAQVTALNGMNITAISAGNGFTVVLTQGGNLLAWGANSSGQLGSGVTNTYSNTPVSITTGTWQSVSAGGSHTTAIRNDGTLWAWGNNSSGQLGAGLITNSSYTPVSIATGTTWQSVSAGGSHTTAIRNDGTLWAWGNNSSGQLGAGLSTSSSYTPVSIATSTTTTWLAVSAGSTHTVAIKSDRSVWAWGDNMYGQLGDNSASNSSIPVQVCATPGDTAGTCKGYLTGITAIAAGNGFTVVLKNDGTVWAWGRNIYGQLGNGTTTDSNTPVQVSGLSGVIAIAADSRSVIALKSDGTVWAWGYDYNGNLGDGTMTDSYFPVQVGSFGTGTAIVTCVAAGKDFSVALKNDGTVWTWGNNYYGQLGNQSTTDSNIPVQILVQVKATDGTSSIIPFSGVSAVAAGDGFTAALKNDGTVWTWGVNWYGQLGDGTATNRNTPVQVTGLSGVTAIVAGSSDTIALKNDGTVWAWGNNANGELGVGSDFTNSHIFPNSSTPVQVVGLAGVVAIASGDRSTFALKNDGSVWAWGANWNGQLGDATTIDRYLPVQITGLMDVTAISAGFRHSLALKNDGTVWAWGVNWYGQLGDGTTSDRSTPVQVIHNGTTLTGVVSISAGDGLSIAMQEDGTVLSWGANYSGQLGNGNITDSWTPVQVQGHLP